MKVPQLAMTPPSMTTKRHPNLSVRALDTGPIKAIRPMSTDPAYKWEEMRYLLHRTYGWFKDK